MVGLLVRLKLSLLRNTLRQSVWRVIGLTVAAVFGLGFLVAGVIGLAAARALAPEKAEAVVVLGGTAMVLGWLVLPLLFFGTDETLDPGRFALFPLSARQLLPGLLAAGAVGVPGVVTTVVALATVVTWSRGVLPAAAALIGAVLGILTCLLAARVLTSAFARILASRRFRDLASVILVLSLLGLSVGGNAVNVVLLGSPQQVEHRFLLAARILGWTPLGWSWSAAAEAAQGRPVIALAKLALAAGLVAALALLWHHFLGRLLTAPLSVGGGGTRIKGGHSLVERTLPKTPVGATALRSLRYLRRDPRYIASAAGVILAPLAITGANVFAVGIEPWIVWAPVMVSWMIGASAYQDTSYDGSAFWTQVTSGIEGRADRLGRVLALLVWSGPCLLLAVLACAALTRQWHVLPEVVGVSGATLLCGIGISAWVSARWQGPVAPPGANPFGSGSGASAVSFLALIVTALLILGLTAPVIALAVATNWIPWLGWVVLVLGPAWGLLVLRTAIRLGGRYLDNHWPEVLEQVSKPVG